MTRQETQLAVLFADMSGGTPLFKSMGDEVASSVEREWFDQLRESLPRFDGRLVKTVGSEALCVFPTADQGVLAASAIQAAALTNPPAGHAIRLRVGLQWGTAIADGEEVFGDSVNVAAYLATVAAPEQIMTTETVYAAVANPLKAVLRPVFRTALRGVGRDAVVYEVLWMTDTAERTDNFFPERIQQLGSPDIGGLLLKYRERTLRIDHQRNAAVLGRQSDCDLAIRDLSASRHHARIELKGMDFYLVDQSINGTYVLADGHPETMVLRREFHLEGSGTISLGLSFRKNPAEVIAYYRDRRSLFRT